MGGIVAGIVVGAVVVFGIIGFAIYKLRTHRPHNAFHIVSQHTDANYHESGASEMKSVNGNVKIGMKLTVTQPRFPRVQTRTRNSGLHTI